MKLIHRLNQLICADAHALIDSIEAPQALLKQSLRNMQAAIDEDERAIKKNKFDSEQLALRAKAMEDQLVKLDKELDLCFGSDNQNLAREVVKKKLYLSQKYHLNSEQLQTAADQLLLLQTQLAENRQQYQQISSQADIFLGQIESRMQKQQFNQTCELNNLVSETDIDIALLSEQAKREAL